MKRSFLVCALMLLCSGAASAQKNKPWTEWSEKEAEKILNESAWGQTQTESESIQQPTQTSAISANTTARREDSNVRAASSVESGEKKDALSVRYYVRWLTAKPIRAAFVRKIELQGAPAEKVAQLRTFVDRDFGDYVVLTINIDGNDRKKMAPVVQLLTTADVAALKPITYLERKDGKRLELLDYRAPIQDGLGAKFVFARSVAGTPFLDENSGEVKFVTELGKTKISRKFKVAEMMYDGKLEY